MRRQQQQQEAAKRTLEQGEPTLVLPSTSYYQPTENKLLLDVENSQSSETTTVVQNNQKLINQEEEENRSLLDRTWCCCCSSSSSKRNQEEKTLSMSKSAKLISTYFIAELLGTFMLVVIGDGAIAAYVLTRKPIDTFCVCFAFGVGAMVATFASAKISGAHINPAATIAFALDGKLSWRLVPVYICAQYLGGFLGALVLFVNYSEAIQNLDGGQRSAFGTTNSTGGIFATYPGGTYVTVWGSLLDQIIGTAVLLFSLSALTDKKNSGLEERHQPLYIAFIIGIVCVAFSPNCGAIFNPARDLAPRLLTAIFGYEQVWSPTNGLYWLTAGVVGPHIGAILGVFTYKLLIGSSLAKKRDYDLEFSCNLDHHTKQQQQHHQMQTSKFAGGGHQHHHHHHHDTAASGGGGGQVSSGGQQADITYGSAAMR